MDQVIDCTVCPDGVLLVDEDGDGAGAYEENNEEFHPSFGPEELYILPVNEQEQIYNECNENISAETYGFCCSGEGWYDQTLWEDQYKMIGTNICNLYGRFI